MAEKKILLIEDDLNTRNLYMDLLSSKGYEVEFAADGKEGLLKAEEGSYDLVLLDIMLPHVDGLEILSALKKDGESKMKIALFTNLSSKDVIDEARAKGADAFLLKSDLDPGKFLEKVKNLLE